MDFTELFKHSAFQTLPSPCSKFLATAYQARLVIRDAESLLPMLTHTSSDAITGLEWSADSEYMLAVAPKADTVYVFGIRNGKWKATIDESVLGLKTAKWAPDARHILVFSDLNVHSLINSVR